MYYSVDSDPEYDSLEKNLCEHGCPLKQSLFYHMGLSTMEFFPCKHQFRRYKPREVEDLIAQDVHERIWLANGYDIQDGDSQKVFEVMKKMYKKKPVDYLSRMRVYRIFRRIWPNDDSIKEPPVDSDEG